MMRETDEVKDWILSAGGLMVREERVRVASSWTSKSALVSATREMSILLNKTSILPEDPTVIAALVPGVYVDINILKLALCPAARLAREVAISIVREIETELVRAAW